MQPKEVPNELLSEGSATVNRVQGGGSRSYEFPSNAQFLHHSLYPCVATVSEAILADLAETKTSFSNECNDTHDDIENPLAKMREADLKKSEEATARTRLQRAREESQTQAIQLRKKEAEAEVKRLTEEFKRARLDAQRREIEANARVLEYEEREEAARIAASSSLILKLGVGLLERLFTGRISNPHFDIDNIAVDIRQYHEMARQARADVAEAQMAADDARKRLEQVLERSEMTRTFHLDPLRGIQPEVWPTEEEFQFAKDRIQYDPEKIHFAICGSPGSGKSSLVNAFRGVRNNHPDAAPAGVVETTKDIMRYPDPREELPWNRLVWFECPNTGRLEVPGCQYFNQKGLFIFDAIVLVYDMVIISVDCI